MCHDVFSDESPDHPASSERVYVSEMWEGAVASTLLLLSTETEKVCD